MAYAPMMNHGKKIERTTMPTAYPMPLATAAYSRYFDEILALE